VTESISAGLGQLSLMSGWAPAAAQVLAAAALVRVVVKRSRRWRAVWLPATAVMGLLTAVAAHWLLESAGIAGEPAPRQLWLWVGLSGMALGCSVAAWSGNRWTLRNLCVFATSLCLLSTGLVVNAWIGYFPTVGVAWSQLTGRPLPDQMDWADVTSMQRSAQKPTAGALLVVTIPDDRSGFRHRQELVYLPPLWFASSPPPRLPALMMIGGEFNTPADWVRAGDAVTTLDAFAASHGGHAPVTVFVDSTGSFVNDTECVNGPRGNAADHLTRDLVPFLVDRFGVHDDSTHWGVVGFSSGGTCAVDLTVMHPELFSVFADIAGDLGPNAGTKAQTIDRLYGGNAAAWSHFDPSTVITRHGAYTGLSGVFVSPEMGASSLDGHQRQRCGTGNDGGAEALCVLSRAHGIDSSVLVLPGRHVWPFAAAAFAAVLPWLAGELDTPGVAQISVPESDP
jgi:S-formylglutathione hydrolase FrmB